MRAKAYIVIAVFCAVLALHPSAAQTPREVDALLVVQHDVGIAMRQLQAIRALSNAHDDRVIRWIDDNRLRLLPPFLMEMARRQLARDPDKALESLAFGWIRARYDGFRCADRTAAQGADMIVRLAGEPVLNHRRRHPASFSKAGLRALQRPDLFKQGGSDSAWICSHGINAYIAGLGGKAVDRETILKPEREWPAIEKQLRDHFSRYFEDLAKPHPDPIPMASNAAPVLTLGADMRPKGWTTDGALVVMESRLREKRILFRMWRPGRELTTIVDIDNSVPTGTQACVSDNHLHVLRGPPPLGSGPVRMATLTRYRLTDAAELEETREVPSYSAIDPVLGPSSVWSSQRHQSHLDCTIFDSTPLSGGVARTQWLRLRGDHGWVRLQNTGSQPTELHFHPSRDVPGTAIGTIGPHASVSLVRWYRDKQRYFLAARSASEPDVVGWWLHPGAATAEPVRLPASPSFRAGRVYPSGDRWIAINGLRSTVHGEKSGGIYLRTAEGHEVKIVDAFVSNHLPSPDGCWVALTHRAPGADGTEASQPAYRRNALGVTNICAHAGK